MAFHFPSNVRLSTKAEFQSVFANKKRKFSQFYIAYYQKNRFTYARLGAVVGKRYVRRAVARNRLKRLAREIFRLQQHQLASFDIVLIAKANAVTASNIELRRCLLKLLQQFKK